MEKSKEGTPKRLLELDCLRGIAAISVVFFHFTLVGSHISKFSYGATGVELFFMISGFVIFMSIDKLQSIKEFIIHRVARLYPTYWTCIFFTFALQCITYQFYFHSGIGLDKLKMFLVNLTMFQHYFNVGEIEGASWTLAIELAFYIFICALSFLKLTKYIEPLGLCILILVYYIEFSGNPHLVFLLQNSFVGFFHLFLAGIVFYKMFTEKQNILRYLIVVLCAIFEIIYFPQRGFAESGMHQYEYIIIISLFFGLFILFINKKLKFIVVKPLIYLGTVSYALYMVHGFMSIGFFIPGLTKILHINYWLSCFITLILVLVVAHIITFKIEIPFRSKLKRSLYKLFIKDPQA